MLLTKNISTVVQLPIPTIEFVQRTKNTNYLQFDWFNIQKIRIPGKMFFYQLFCRFYVKNQEEIYSIKLEVHKKYT